MELFAMTAAVARAHGMRIHGSPVGAEAIELADVFCRDSRRVVEDRFRQLWHNGDVRKYALGSHVLGGKDVWLEEGIVGLGAKADGMAPG